MRGGVRVRMVGCALPREGVRVAGCELTVVEVMVHAAVRVQEPESGGPGPEEGIACVHVTQTGIAMRAFCSRLAADQCGSATS